jgi:hypothetical protein
MQVFHTAGVPPSTGNSILAIIGSTEKSNAALTKIVKANRSVRMLIFDFRLDKSSLSEVQLELFDILMSVPGVG